MAQDQEKADEKRVVAQGFGWRRLEGGDERHVWDPKDKARLKELAPTWIFQAIAIAIIVLLSYLCEK